MNKPASVNVDSDGDEYPLIETVADPPDYDEVFRQVFWPESPAPTPKINDTDNTK